ncbi:hypothetical protein BDR05DRAFT_958602 [Suillus weaverae]|nr:hypothetical protein BDR05DRAFT_958602 [Suillus weaverae]
MLCLEVIHHTCDVPIAENIASFTDQVVGQDLRVSQKLSATLIIRNECQTLGLCVLNVLVNARKTARS